MFIIINYLQVLPCTGCRAKYCVLLPITANISFMHKLGIEDKIKSTNGYCIVTTDEGTGLFKDLKNKESKHESDLSLLNQLYDGKGDKTTLAKEYQRVIPNNSTSICISLQQEGYLTGITGLGSTNWLDSGFSERFMILASRPFR